MSTLSLCSLFVLYFLLSRSQALTLTSRLIHRFSDEARSVTVAAGGGGVLPDRRSPEYYRLLATSDLQRQKKRIGNVKYQNLFPAEGSDAFSLGNDFGWCSLVFGASIMQDKDLGMYNPAKSRTSRHLSCSNELCDLGTSCKSPKQPCPYTINYLSENTSTSGLLVEDILYLAASGEHTSVQAPVIIGCGRRQSGGYLDGIAPDGLLGLGFGNISVPSILSKSGLVHNSFSMCFRDDDSGQLFFGDQGASTQQSTPFVPLEGKYVTYIVEVDSFCIKNQCLEKTNFQAIVDSGTSFTLLPQVIYKKVTREFDRQINASRFVYDGSDWEYCYKASPLEIPTVPTLTLMLAVNKSFTVTNPVFLLYGKEEEIVGFCLPLQSSSDGLGIIGQNHMTGYRMVFDRENLKLGWSHSNCRDLENSRTVPLTPPPQNRTENPLPTNQQQSSPNGRAVSPAVAGRAPTAIPSTASHRAVNLFCSFLLLLAHLTVILVG